MIYNGCSHYLLFEHGTKYAKGTLLRSKSSLLSKSNILRFL